MAVEIITQLEAQSAVLDCMSTEALVAELAKRGELAMAVAEATPDMLADDLGRRARDCVEGAERFADAAEANRNQLGYLEHFHTGAANLAKRAGNLAAAVVFLMDHKKEHPLCRAALKASTAAGLAHARCCALLERARLTIGRREVARG